MICYKKNTSSSTKPLSLMSKMEDYAVSIIIVGVISWTTLFLLIRKLLPNRSFDFSRRLVSTTHAILSVILASFSVNDWSCPVCPVASHFTPLQMQTLAVTMGYLLYDLICSQFHKRSSLDNIIHHLVGIIGGGAGLSYQKCGSEMVATIFITEISSPFLHLREFLKEVGYRDTHLNLAADIIFAVIFSIARMVVGPCLAYVILSANNPFLIKFTHAGNDNGNTTRERILVLRNLENGQI